jgi:uncharacterized protein YbjT (DUF2867 family)
MSKKIIAVIGATGAQGGGLIDAILADESGEFAARAITRNPGSDKARALAEAGAEVVEADVNDLDSLKNAFDGAYGAFCVTFFWDHFSPETELEQARKMALAADAAGVKHVIWSTLEDTRNWMSLDDDRMPTLQGKYKVPHFDAKGEANAIFTDEVGVPTTILNTCFYWENFIFFGSGPQRMEDGSLALVFPLDDAKMPSIAVDDIGKCALGIFKRPELIGETIGIAGGHHSGQEFADAMSAALGKEIKYVNVPADVYRSFDFPGADDVGNMFQFKRDFEDEYRAARPLDKTRELNPDLTPLSEWMAANAERIPIPE